jgi:hypothetical protein
MRVAELAEQVSKQFVFFEQKFDRRFEEADRKFGEIDRRFDDIDLRFEKVDRRFDSMERLMLHLHDETMTELRAMRQENVMRDGRLDRHERWIGQLADRTDTRLES